MPTACGCGRILTRAQGLCRRGAKGIKIFKFDRFDLRAKGKSKKCTFLTL